MAQRIRLLLSWHLEASVHDTLSLIGFDVLSSKTEAAAEQTIMDTAQDIDAAVEYQCFGPDHFPVRDLLRKYGKTTPILLCLNCRTEAPANLADLGYVGILPFPFRINVLTSTLAKILPQ